MYPALLGEDASSQQRLELNAYLLAGITEYWRPYRHYGGGLHFVYLTSSDPEGYTSDHFRDVQKLELHSDFRDYMSNAFAPVGVFLSFWQPATDSGSVRSIPVMLVNDEYVEVKGKLTLATEDLQGSQVSVQSAKFRIAPLGQETIYSDVKFPKAIGDFLLRAVIRFFENGKEIVTPESTEAQTGSWFSLLGNEAPTTTQESSWPPQTSTPDVLIISYFIVSFAKP